MVEVVILEDVLEEDGNNKKRCMCLETLTKI